MKLWYNPASPFARKVRIVARETGQEKGIEEVSILVSPVKPHPDLARENPLVKIPALSTPDQGTLYDSTVICEYLDSLHSGARYFPQAPRERWRALRWHALGDNMLDNLVLWRNESLRPGVQQSPEILAALEAKIRSSLAFLDAEAAALDKAAIGIGHVGIAAALGYLDFRFPGLGWRDGHPRLAAWYEAFSQRPSIRNTRLVDDGR